VDAKPEGGAQTLKKSGLIVAIFTLVSLGLHLSGQATRPLWGDEACTYWTLQAGPLDILQGARTAGTPPLYFLLAWLSTTLLGTGELALRSASLFAGVALVPAVYLAGRRHIGERSALIAAFLTTISPLVQYYAVEARNYTWLQLLSLTVLACFLSILDRPGRRRAWLWLGIALVLTLYTHNWALFLLPALPVAAFAAGGEQRRILAIRAFGISAVAFIAYLPWLLVVSEVSSLGVADWIVAWWEETPPAAAIFRSLEVFGVGGDYPRYLAYLGRFSALPEAADRGLRALSILTTAGVLCLASARTFRARESAVLVLWCFLLVPLLMALAHSYLRYPIYLVGRYDTIALPAFLLLSGAAIDALLNWAPRLGWILPATLTALASVSLSTSFGEAYVAEPQNVAVPGIIARKLREGDVLVTTGMRRAMVEYYLHRNGIDLPIYSFPPEVAEHLGWYSPERFEADPTLSDQGADLASELAEIARRGHAVWLLLSYYREIDLNLTVPLSRSLELDAAHSSKKFEVWRLVSKSQLP
jgi:hypothetical protein